MLREMDAPPGTLRANVHFPIAGIAPEWKVVARFAASRGVRTMWAHLDDGVAFLRMLAPPTASLQDMADDLTRQLAREGIDADVGNEAADEHALMAQLREMAAALERMHRGAP